MKKLFSALLVTIAAATPLLISLPVWSQIRQERVTFERGKSGTTIQGKIRGEQSVDYLLRANAGQNMTAVLNSDNGGTYFNIYAPGTTPASDEAMFRGDINDNAFEGKLPATGDYRMRVFLFRSAARQNETANYRLQINVVDNTNADAKVPGTNFSATGNVPCSMKRGQPTGSCPFGVARRGNGTADVTVKKPDGRSRVIFFENGKAINANTSEADGGEFSSSKEADLFIIRIGEERYEIPEAVVFGG